MPAALRFAAVLTGLEAIGLGVYCVAIGVAAQDSRGSSVSATGTEIAAYLVFAALLGLLCRGLVRRKALARTPYLLAQLFVMIVGYTVFKGDGAATTIAGSVLLLVGFAGAVSAFSPSLVSALQDGSGSD